MLINQWPCELSISKQVLQKLPGERLVAFWLTTTSSPPAANRPVGALVIVSADAPQAQGPKTSTTYALTVNQGKSGGDYAAPGSDIFGPSEVMSLRKVAPLSSDPTYSTSVTKPTVQ